MVNNINNTGPGGNAGSNPPAGIGGASPGVIPGVSKAKQGLRNEVTAVANGVGTQFPDTGSIAVNGQSYTKQQLLAALQATLALYSGIDQANQALKSQRLALKSDLPEVRQLLAGIKAALIAYFGKGNPVLVAYGFNVQKPRQLTLEQKTARKAKAAATRGIRGTVGKAKKALLKYTGEVVVQTKLSGAMTPGGDALPAGGNAGTSAGGSSTSGAGTDSSKS